MNRLRTPPTSAAQVSASTLGSGTSPRRASDKVPIEWITSSFCVSAPSAVDCPQRELNRAADLFKPYRNSGRGVPTRDIVSLAAVPREGPHVDGLHGACLRYSRHGSPT